MLLFIVGCEETGLTTNSLTSGTAVTDTLYVYNNDTLIITNYDTTIIYDTLIINQICNYSAVIDDCGVCSGGTTGMKVNYLQDECGICEGNNTGCRDCMGVVNGSAILDDCGQCWVPNSNSYAQCDIKVDVQLDIEPLSIFNYSDWISGNVSLASLNLSNITTSPQQIYISYYASLNNVIVVKGILKSFEISSGEKITISNANINLHNIIKYEENLSGLSLSTLGNLISGNYNITIYVKQASGFTMNNKNYYNNSQNLVEDVHEGTILGYYLLDSLYQTP